MSKGTFAKLSEYSLAIHKFGEGYYFWDFNNGTLNTACRLVLDQKQFYSEHKQKYGYKSQLVIISKNLVFNLIWLFIRRRDEW